MARVNQGKYKKYRNECKNLFFEIKELMKTYFDDIGFTDDYLGLFDFLDSANCLYERAEKLKFKIETILETQKFEQDKTTQEYESFVSELANIMYELSARAGEVRGYIGNDVSENEKYSLDNWKI